MHQEHNLTVEHTLTGGSRPMPRLEGVHDMQQHDTEAASQVGQADSTAAGI